MQSVAIFCGSSPGKPEYSDAVVALADELVQRNIRVIYGGANVGTMGTLADAILERGGEVIGVLTQQLLEKNIGHTQLTDLHIADSMHARKALMAELADGVIALPGGLGTLDEFFEFVTWTQLDLHAKPAGLLNVSGYYDHLTKFLDHAVGEMFLKIENRELVLTHDNPTDLLDAMQSWQPAYVSKWIDTTDAPL